MTTCPALAQPLCDMVVHQDEDPCHTRSNEDSHLAGSLAETEADGQSAPDNCCTTGCLDCGLPCCTGIATLLTFAPAVNFSDCVQTQLLTYDDQLVSVDPNPIYHPPRI